MTGIAVGGLDLPMPPLRNDIGNGISCRRQAGVGTVVTIPRSAVTRYDPL
jgi:hypothetical protein